MLELTRHDVATALDEIVGELLSAGEMHSPPVDALALAERLSLTVSRNDEQPERGRFVRLRSTQQSPGGGTIVIKTDPRPERMHWAVAHEIGEHCAHRAFERLGLHPGEAPPNYRERVASALASRILLPSQWFFADGVRLRWDLPKLKLRYSTASHELTARRMLDGEPQVIISIFDNQRLTSRQSNLGRRAPPLLDVERVCQQTAHESLRTTFRKTSHVEVTAWPIHEPPWLREILRTAVLDFGECVSDVDAALDQFSAPD